MNVLNKKAKVKALVLAGFGINCDNETRYALDRAGAEAHKIHINQLIETARQPGALDQYHIMAVGGGFSWADDHGGGVLLGLKLRARLGPQIKDFIAAGKLVIGICNGFQALVNMGLLPESGGDQWSRTVALTANDCGNFRNDWVHLSVDPTSKCVFTKGIENIELPIRHGEGKFQARPEIIEKLKKSGQVALRYSKPSPEYLPAQGQFPYNPNGSLDDIAGICDETGRVFGLMPHPEAFHHLTNHPDWTRLVDRQKRTNTSLPDMDGDGLAIFRNAVRYVEENLAD